MRKVILSMMVSLDGSIARANGELDWFLTDEAFEVEMLDLLHSVDACIFGRTSYEQLAAYWPTAGTAAAEETPGGFTSKARQVEFAELMNTLPKIVCSRTLSNVSWTPARILKDDIPGAITRMKQEPGKDLVLFAGADIAATFMAHDLFDEYRLMVHPVVLGNGVPLFRDLPADRTLKLLRARTLPSGVVLMHYVRERS